MVLDSQASNANRVLDSNTALVYSGFMKNRIRDLREGRGWSQQELADKIGTSQSQVDRLEKNQRRLSDHWLERLGKAFNIPPIHFFTEEPACLVPIVGTIGAGYEIYPIDDMPLIPRIISDSDREQMNCEWVEAPPGVYPKGIVAVRVAGTSMMPYMKPGTIIYYSERFEGAPPERCLRGGLCVVQTVTGQALLKMVKKSKTDGKFDLISYNDDTIPAVELAWCAPVLFIKPPI